jgi:hypothetical protein
LLTRQLRSRPCDVQVTVQEVQVDAVIKGLRIRLCDGVATRQDQRCEAADQQESPDGYWSPPEPPPPEIIGVGPVTTPVT